MIKRSRLERIAFVLFAICIFIGKSVIYAEDSDYYNTHSKGWHWYEEPESDQDSNDENEDPVKQMNAVKATINRALDKAIINPTEDNITNYITLQNKLSNQSNKFSNVWKMVLLNHPELDYSIDHPTNNTAKQIENDQVNAQEEKAIRNLAKQSGLFFFYRSTCPYCQKFSPIVKEFSERYNISVIPVTTDGISLPEFPNSYIDQGQSAKFNVTVEPALFAVDPYTHKAYPVSYGLISEEDLKKRILDIANNFSGGGE